MNMNKQIYGVSSGDQGYGSGDILKGTEYKESTPDSFLQVKDMEGNWVDVYSVFTIENNEVITLA